MFLRLVENADVFVSNFKPGTLDGWGVGYADGSQRNPRIIYAMGSSFGPEGPDAQREGADLSGQAGGGIISTTGGAGSDPSPIGATIADHISGQNLLAGVLAALSARKTGRGQLVETSLLGGQVWAQAGEITKYLMSGEMTGPSNRGHSMVPGIYGMFATSDGWIAIVGVAGPLPRPLLRDDRSAGPHRTFQRSPLFRRRQGRPLADLGRGIRHEDHGGVVQPSRRGGTPFRSRA